MEVELLFTHSFTHALNVVNSICVSCRIALHNFAYMMHSSTKIVDRHAASTAASTAGSVSVSSASGGGGGGGATDQMDILLSMGFAKELIELVLESTPADTPFDVTVSMLSEMGGGAGAGAGTGAGGDHYPSSSGPVATSPRR